MNGDRIREQRLKLGFTLKELSEKTGYSVSYISQLERGLSQPSLATLRKLAESLQCSEVWLLMGHSEDQRFSESISQVKNRGLEYVMYKENRIQFVMPESETNYYIMTPSQLPGDEQVSMTALHVVLQPRKWVSEKLICHQTIDEIVIVTKGQIRAVIDSQEYNLQAGDSMYIPRRTFHNYINSLDNQDTECIIVFSELIY